MRQVAFDDWMFCFVIMPCVQYFWPILGYHVFIVFHYVSFHMCRTTSRQTCLVPLGLQGLQPISLTRILRMRGNWLNGFGSPHGRRHQCSRARLQDRAVYFLVMGGERTIEGYGGAPVRKAWLGGFLVVDREADAVEQLRLLCGWGGGPPLKIKGVLPREDDRALRSV